MREKQKLKEIKAAENAAKKWPNNWLLHNKYLFTALFTVTLLQFIFPFCIFYWLQFDTKQYTHHLFINEILNSFQSQLFIFSVQIH